MSRITLAIDSATSRLTVAVARGNVSVERHVDGPRRHANEILPLVEVLLADTNANVQDIEHVITGDGPGSFTGLRVSTSVAKAITWGRSDVRWSIAPSLLVRAMSVARATDARPITVLALSDALRGELYAGCWRFEGDRVQRVGPTPRAIKPDALAEFGAVQAVIGSIPEQLRETVLATAGVEPVTGDPALPDARHLIALAGIEGGVESIRDRAAWQPAYGRPAEAQAVWERKFGRPLPDSSYHSG
jgi:tRNA threonylcarbamoyladenosine biosynthesis protein TsaB